MNYNHEDCIKLHKEVQKPTFEVGDWVIRTCNNQKDDLGFPRKILVDNEFLSSTLVQATIDTYALWKPEPGEWCWFWTGDQLPLLCRFDNKTKQYFSIDLSCGGFGFAHCEPFIGELPTNSKNS